MSKYKATMKPKIFYTGTMMIEHQSCPPFIISKMHQNKTDVLLKSVLTLIIEKYKYIYNIFYHKSHFLSSLDW